MKRTLILRYYSLSAFLIYLFFLLYYFFTNSVFFPLWFSFACLLISIYCLLRSIFFHYDSALWIGIFIFLTAFINILQFLEPISNLQITALYFFSGAISSTLVAIMYNNFTFLKLSLILTLEVILLLLYNIGIINMNLFIFLNIILFFILLTTLIHKLYKNKKQKQNKS